jgi:hypothetical protein
LLTQESLSSYKLRMVQAALIRYIALCAEGDLGVVAGALLARLVHLHGREKTLEMLAKLIDRGEAARAGRV